MKIIDLSNKDLVYDKLKAFAKEEPMVYLDFAYDMKKNGIMWPWEIVEELKILIDNTK